MLGIGYHENVPASVYHSDPCEKPSLSSSIAKILCAKTPRHAWLEHPRLNPDFEHEDEKKFDLGTVAHEIILGRGAEIAVIEADDWRSKAAKEARAAAIALGKQPVLEKDHIRACAMAEAVNDGLEKMGIDLSKTANETVLIWQEGETFCRAMLDALDKSDTSAIIYDLKTTGVALEAEAIGRHSEGLFYDLSAAHYARGLVTIFPELAGRIRYRWIFAEADAPHEVRVFEASGLTMELGDRKRDFAVRKWAHCMATGEWPGYARRIDTLFCPDWAEAKWSAREMAEIEHFQGA